MASFPVPAAAIIPTFKKKVAPVVFVVQKQMKNVSPEQNGY